MKNHKWAKKTKNNLDDLYKKVFIKRKKNYKTQFLDNSIFNDKINNYI
jgi:hypothetical protein